MSTRDITFNLKGKDSTGGAFNSVANQFSGLGKSLLSVGAIAGGAALAGVTALTAGITAMVASSVNKAADLDAQMATIAATMNTTKAAVGPLKDLILDLALDPNLTVTATDAANAIQLLAQNGLTMGQIMDGAAASTVALANATGAQFGTAADVASGVMSVFNIEAKDMEAAIDGITGVTNQSKFTIDDYAGAISMAGGVAAGMGVDFDDFNAVIAATATSFSSGSDAGTSFKTFLQRLANPTAKIAEAMDDLGISLFDTEGNMRDMKDVVGQLNGAFGNLTEAEKAEAAAKLGGADASRTVLGLAKLSAAEFDALTDSVNDSGQAFRAAATRVDSIKGAFDIFGGIIEALQIQIGDKFLPVLRRITVAFSGMAAGAGPQLVGFFGQVADGITGLINAGIELFGVFQSKGAGGLFAAMGLEGSALFLNKIAILFGMLGGEGATLGDTIRSTVGTAFEWLSNNLFPTLSAGVQFVIDHFAEFKGALLGVGAVLAAGVFAALAAAVLSLLSPITLIIAGAALLGAAWAGNWGDIQGKTAAAWAVIQPVLMQLVEWLQTNIPIAIQTLSTFWTETLQPMFAATGLFITDTLIPAFTRMWDWLSVNIPAAIQTLSDFWNNTLLPAVTNVVTFITGTLIPSFVNLWTMLTTNITAAIQTVSDIWTTIFLPAITGVWTFISTLIIPLFQSLANLMGAVLGVAITALAGLWQNILLPALTIVWNYYTDKIITVFNEVARVAGAVLGVAITGLTNLWQNTLLPALQKIRSFISSTLIPVFAAAGKAVDEKVAPPISTLTEDILPSLSSGLATVVKWIKEATGFFNGLAQAVSNFQLPDVLQPGSPTPFEVALRGIAEAANLAGDSFGGFQGMLDQLLNLKHIDTGFGAAIGRANDDFEKALDEWMPEAKTKFVMGAFKAALRNNLDFASTATNDQLKELLLGSVSNWETAGIRNVDAAVGRFIEIFRKAQTTLGQEAQAAAAENFQKMLGGIGQFAGVATQEADNLNKRITILNSLLRQGGDAFNVEGQIMNAAQAQERLNQLVAEQAGMQGALSGITGFQAGLQGFQEQRNLLGLLDTPVNQAAGDIVGGLADLTGFLGQQIMAGLGQQLGVPVMPAGGTGVGGGTTNNISFAPVINTTANEQSILQLFYTMLSMVPSGT